MKKYEYKVFNMSEIDRAKAKNPQFKGITGRDLNLIDVLNEHGKEGWEVLFPITETKSAYLLKREVKDEQDI